MQHTNPNPNLYPNYPVNEQKVNEHKHDHSEKGTNLHSNIAPIHQKHVIPANAIHQEKQIL
jgi:hypothetical protein